MRTFHCGYQTGCIVGGHSWDGFPWFPMVSDSSKGFTIAGKWFVLLHCVAGPIFSIVCHIWGLKLGALLQI